MNIAMHTWMRSEPLSRTIERLSSLGYDQVEIAGTPESIDTTEVKALLDQHQLTCCGSVTLMIDGRNMLSADPAVREASTQYAKDCATMVAELGGTYLSVVPGTVGKIIPDATPEEEWEWAVASMKDLYTHTEAIGIRIGIEPINRFETYFINRGAQALALAEATGKNCGVCLDIFHMNIEEADPIATIKEIGEAGRLVGFHVADSNRMAPGQGHLDWSAIISALREVDFRGPLSVEFSPPIDRTPANQYPNAIEKNPTGVTAEQRKFLEDHGSNILSDEWYTELTDKAIKTLRSHSHA